jgi:hypothetical protein
MVYFSPELSIGTRYVLGAIGTKFHPSNKIEVDIPAHHLELAKSLQKIIAHSPIGENPPRQCNSMVEYGKEMVFTGGDPDAFIESALFPFDAVWSMIGAARIQGKPLPSDISLGISREFYRQIPTTLFAPKLVPESDGGISFNFSFANGRIRVVIDNDGDAVAHFVLSGLRTVYPFDPSDAVARSEILARIENAMKP